MALNAGVELLADAMGFEEGRVFVDPACSKADSGTAAEPFDVGVKAARSQLNGVPKGAWEKWPGAPSGSDVGDCEGGVELEEKSLKVSWSIEGSEDVINGQLVKLPASLRDLSRLVDKQLDEAGEFLFGLPREGGEAVTACARRGSDRRCSSQCRAWRRRGRPCEGTADGSKAADVLEELCEVAVRLEGGDVAHDDEATPRAGQRDIEAARVGHDPATLRSLLRTVERMTKSLSWPWTESTDDTLASGYARLVIDRM